VIVARQMEEPRCFYGLSHRTRYETRDHHTRSTIPFVNHPTLARGGGAKGSSAETPHKTDGDTGGRETGFSSIYEYRMCVPHVEVGAAGEISRRRDETRAQPTA
jgi:hypothetical protein